MVEVAAIVPCHRQPGLLAEALASFLGQQGAPELVAIFVDDGCPYPETREVALSWAALHPGRVHYLRRPNGGLPAARNTGVDHALATFPRLRAVLPLDADNRLHPHFVARSLSALDAAAARTGWAWPDVDMFGLARNLSAAGAHAVLQHLAENVCEAGSLIRADLFRGGLRYDEALREGFEDWDFWLQAIAAGWRGVHVPMAGLQYRHRPESMRLAAEAQREALVARLRTRHRAMFAPHGLLAAEAAEAPRFALFDADGADWFADPADPAGWRHLDAGPAHRALLSGTRAPEAVHHPRICVFAAPGGLPALAAQRVLRGAFWQAEAMLRERHAVVLRLMDAAPGAMSLEVGGALEADSTQGAAILVRSSAVSEAAERGADHWLSRLAEGRPDARCGVVRIQAGTGWSAGSGAATALGDTLKALRATPLPRRAGWRQDIRRPRRGAAPLLEALHGIGATLPLRPGGRSIGFVLPLFGMGGVERVVANQAAVLRRRGWRTVLAVLAPEASTLPDDLAEAFDEVVLAPMAGLAHTDPARDHLGAALPAAMEGRDLSDLLGLFAPLGAVVVTHAPAGHVLAARLRRLGVRLYAALHLVEEGPFGAPLGNPHALLGWEAAYDGVLVISEHLAAWCEAQGIPRAKLHLVRNAPGYASAGGPARALRDGPMRVLFLGRLDAQKGADRLPAIMAATAHLPIEWRIAGRAVLGGGVPWLSAEPPATTPAALDALYGWADVVILPSRFEGVPLTVLEAQRMGCAVVATDTGALREIVVDGVDGLLVPREEDVEAGFAAALHRLAADPALRMALGHAGAARVAGLDWDTTFGTFADHLEREAPA